MKSKPLNLILYGPPGTGKTHTTIDKAVELICPDYFHENRKDREKIKQKFDELLIRDWQQAQGRIGFCTFHQSLSYEDFVEGIKPRLQEDNEEEATGLEYFIKPGIFRSMAERAESYKPDRPPVALAKAYISEEEFKQNNFFKISLGDSNNPDDNGIYEYCAENNCICIGFASHIDFTAKTGKQISDACRDNGASGFSAEAITYFKEYLKVGDFVMVSKGNYTIRAFGIVTGEYEYRPDAPIEYLHFRKVDWIFKNESIPIGKIYHKMLSQRTIYKFAKQLLKKEFFARAAVTPGPGASPQEKLSDAYVLIIDEINRGNVSQIFGELITLVESSKRKSTPEALSATLPYSRKEFSVPVNLYIVGTMNTADRSVEALDTALRRRFSFEFVAPDATLLAGKTISSINLQLLLEILNKRITFLLDEDRTIGHSFFMKASDITELQVIFTEEIIPLLREYFYNDYGKIRLILGDKFVKVKEDKPQFAVGDNEIEKDTYEFVSFKSDADFVTALQDTLIGK